MSVGLLLLSAAEADEIILRNGDRLSGDVIRQADGQLRLQTTYAGEIIWVSWTGLRVPLFGGFVGSIEYEIDYDSAPTQATKTTDKTLRLKIGYQW